MNNQIHNSIIADKSYQNFKIAIGVSIIPILFGIALLIEPFFVFVLIGLTPIWGSFLLLTIIFSAAGIIEGRKLLNKNEATPKTKMSVYGNAVILTIGLFIVISVIVILSNGFV